MNKIQQFVSRYVGLEKELQRRIEEEKRGWETVVVEAWRGGVSSAGQNVTPGSSLQMAAVFACVRVLWETIASLPLFIYEREEDGKKRAQDYYLYELLHDRPNPRMTAFEYREMLQSHLALWGNAYSRIVYDGSGQIQELWPLRPGGILQSEYRNGLRYYLYQAANGKTEWLSAVDIWHLKGLSSDGEYGYSPIALMKRAIGLGISAEEFGSKFFENDARPGVILEHPGKLSEKAHQNLVDDLKSEHQGSAKASKPMVLEEGMKLHEVGVPPDHAQFLETRKFQVIEIARIFRMPPHMIGDLERATFSNIEHQSIDFVVHTIRPWLVRWEQSINQNLMLKEEREKYYAEHLVDGLLRGDTKSRYESYSIGRQNRWLSANDIRRLENMDAIDGGDAYLMPLNMAPADQANDSTKTDETDEEEDTKPKRKATRRSAKKEMQINAQQRLYIARSFKDIFLKTSQRAMKRETSDVNKQMRKMLGDNPDAALLSFQQWLDVYYEEFNGIRAHVNTSRECEEKS